MIARLAMLVLASVAGCAHAPLDRDTMCGLLQLDHGTLASLSPRELAALSRGTPAEPLAVSAHAQGVSAITDGTLGGAAILAGLVTLLAVDPATHPEARNAGIGLGAAALAGVGTAWILGFTARATTERARARLRELAAHCR
jgi:hypothetical protein